MQRKFDTRIRFFHLGSASRFLFAVFVCVILLFSGCNRYENNVEINAGEFSVHYLDVGQGDAIFINFPDGKTMLIDTGLTDDATAEFIKSTVIKSKPEIDYFVLTHPDVDHIGNAQSIIEEFNVEKLFVPKIVNENLFPRFREVMQTAREKEIEITVSDNYKYESGDGWFFAMLSPKPYLSIDSIYNTVNASTDPSPEEINDLSPIIYLEYRGVRFLFTGDAGFSQEKLVVDSCKAGVYDYRFNGNQIDIMKIDFLKMGHHGSDESSSEKFLQYVTPQNAVISVGDNNYGLPSKYSLIRLVQVNSEVNLFRTDTAGSISVYVNGEGAYEVKTSK